MLGDAAYEHSVSKKVTVIMHDWGCVFGWLFLGARPELVHRVAALDIGPTFARNPLSIFSYLNYQLFFALLFVLGEPIGGNVFRKILAKPCAHRDIESITARMGYPYYHVYFGKVGISPKEGYPYNLSTDNPNFRPTYFAYGRAKGVMFHDFSSLEQLRDLESKGCKVEVFKSDHWIQVEQAQGLNWSLHEWLDETDHMINKKD